MPIIRLSRDGSRELEADVQRLEAERTLVAARTGQARERGNDPTENLDLRDAIDGLALVEGHIAELRGLLATAEPLEDAVNGDRARLGSAVTIRLSRGEVAMYVLVSAAEAARRRGRLSVESPIGRALSGTRLGDEVVEHTPNGPEHLTAIHVG